jgi:Holliday junction resolvase
MSQKICLMLTTTENRKFFISRKYLKQLIDFSENFGCNISIVKTDTKNIKTIQDFIKLLCNQNYTDNNSSYVIMKKNLQLKKRQNTKAKKIRDTIEKTFMQNQKTSLEEIKKLFFAENISTSSLSTHFSEVRKKLSIRGIQIEMIKKGTYMIKSSP